MKVRGQRFRYIQSHAGLIEIHDEIAVGMMFEEDCAGAPFSYRTELSQRRTCVRTLSGNILHLSAEDVVVAPDGTLETVAIKLYVPDGKET